MTMIDQGTPPARKESQWLLLLKLLLLMTLPVFAIRWLAG